MKDLMFKGWAGKFTAEEFSLVYDTHIKILQDFKAKHPQAYHAVMEQLFAKMLYVYP